MRAILCSVFVFLMAAAAYGQGGALWLRYPAISPDGATVLFEYKGDIYSVPAAGGTATAMTMSESYEFAPVWSHDGRSIAFASDRYGNFDVFVMPAGGGEAKRLTYHSTREVPSSFTADDKAVYFNAARQDAASNAQFPIGLISELYSVPVAGGRVTQVMTTPAIDATVDSTGTKLIYHDIKGYESDWRKHHTSAVTRDIWTYDLGSKQYIQLTTFNGEDRNPVFDANDKDYYYLSEQSGSFNVYKSSLAAPTKSTALTHFTKHPVRFLTRSKTGTMCFSYDGELYTMKGGEPTKLSIRVAADGRDAIDKIVPVNGGFTEAKLSPNGKEFAFAFRGEIFVSSLDGKTTKRITNTPWQERSVSFSPDGRSLVFAAEKGSNWNVYTMSITRKEEPYFYVSTVLKEEAVVATAAEEYQPAFSPDGKEVAYLENRQILKVINLATKQSRVILPADRNYSYADGDQYYQWSPDGKWFLVQFGLDGRMFVPEVGLIASDGKGELINLTRSGYDDFGPKWSMDGKMMIWGSTREGSLNQGGGANSGDVYGMYFTKALYDRSKLTKEEAALLKEQEDKAEKEKKEADKTASPSPSPTPKPDEAKKPIQIDLDGLTERKSKLTAHTSPAGDWVLSKDGEKLFYLTSFEKGNDIWVTELRTKETKLFYKLGADNPSLEMSADGKFLFVLADGKVVKVDAESAKAEPAAVNTEMVLKYSDEKAYIFDHSWREFKEKLIFPDLNGVDWDFYYTAYKRFLPYINNNYDYAEMVSEMLGEMNVSHTGCYYRANFPNTDQTASLGLLYDYSYTGSGAKVAEVIDGGPADKASSMIRAGNVIEMIDGVAIDDKIDFYQLLNRKAGKLTLLSVFDPAANKRWEETVKPVSGGDEGELLYKRWIRNRRAEVDRLSGGKIGYVHIRAMNDASMRVAFDEALGLNLGKDAIIVDTRFNGGGNIHEQLSDFLSGKKYFDVIPHGQYIGYEPIDKWIKPSIVLMGESNYSDAHLFPLAYKAKGVGKLLGMPVPGTGTFVWWENQIDPTLRFGIPMGCWQSIGGKCAENIQTEPDIRVRNEGGIMSAGRDQQIEEAVKELMKKK
ncbi:S41 family peptidase [soil metagenome]